MKVWDHVPAGHALNADFVTRRSLDPDERYLSLQVDLENLPAVGLLGVREYTVRQMCDALGWKLQSAEHRADVKAMREELADARRRLAEYEAAAEVLKEIA